VIDPLWLTLPVKMLAGALIVVSASLVVERSGPFVGALIATLPISAGPAYVFLAIDHGPEFIARSALASIVACGFTGLFVVLYAHLAQRHGLLVCLAACLGLWLACAVIASAIPWTFWSAFGFAIVTYGGGTLLARRWQEAPAQRRAERRWWDIPLRAATVMLVVLVVVLAGRLLGPTMAGLLALMPVVFTSLVIVLHPRIGGPATAAVMAHGMPGMIGFTIGVLVLHATAVPLGSTLALSLALAVCVGWNLGLFALRRRVHAKPSTGVTRQRAASEAP
jgi:hypothetical protein